MKSPPRSAWVGEQDCAPPEALTARRRIDGVVEAFLVIAMTSMPTK
jgi:hypothetical protein